MTVCPAATHLLAIPGSATHWGQCSGWRTPHSDHPCFLGQSLFHVDPGPMCKGNRGSGIGCCRQVQRSQGHTPMRRLAVLSQRLPYLQDESQRRQRHTGCAEGTEHGLVAVITVEHTASSSVSSSQWLLWRASPLYSGLGRGLGRLSWYSPRL